MKSKDGVSQTPLSRVAMCEHKHGAVVKLLLEKGPDVKSQNGVGQMPLSRDVRGGYKRL
jgi:ankyrin repeat protein